MDPYNKYVDRNADDNFVHEFAGKPHIWTLAGDPQTFVPNIFFARPEDHRKAEITILRSKEHSTAVWLPVVQ